MLRGFIVRKADGLRVPVGVSLIVGRTGECGLVIDDTAASRRHLEITARGDSFAWKDLGSTNGTAVNGARMLAGELKHGDVIQIGETELRFEVEETPDEATAEEDATMFRGDVFSLRGEASTVHRENKAAALLQALYTVTNQISTNYELCSLINRILETTMRAINAQRGALFLADEQGELLPCPVCGNVHAIRDGVLLPRKPGALKISGTVARRVIRDGESVLFQDTDSDGELSTAESIVALNLRSILCVPLRAKNGILGILYIDSDRPNHSYTEEDMLLATSVGASAGLAIENARMHQEMLEKQRIEQEIATAWRIQEGFLVKDWPEDDPRFQIYGDMRPAKTVGGGFYDFVRPDEHTVGLLIGDVSGKGVPAALTMAQLLAEFRLRALEFRSPAAVLGALNGDLVARTQSGMFCTMCYLLLDLRTGRVTCANAGHLPALRVGASGGTFFGGASGPPAGILPDASWLDEMSEIALGDAILLYTDGIAEARRTFHGDDGARKSGPVGEYDPERLARVAHAVHDQPPRAIIEAVVQDVVTFCAPGAPHDDCTLISVRYLGHA